MNVVEEWRPWAGGECPSKGYVDIQLRSGREIYGVPASRYLWGRVGASTNGGEIVAYREIGEPA